TTSTTSTTSTTTTVAPTTPIAATGPGNPYDFYTSVASCAAAQEARCSACLPKNTCRPITNSGDGGAECRQFDAQGDNGRGYALMRADLALEIDAVASCTRGAAPQCAQAVHAAETLGKLANNADFVDDATCSDALDACLSAIYGDPPLPPVTLPPPTPAAAGC